MTLLGGAYLYEYCPGVPPHLVGREVTRYPNNGINGIQLFTPFPKSKMLSISRSSIAKLWGLINSWLGANWLGPYQLGFK